MLNVSQPLLCLLRSFRYFLCYINLSVVSLGLFLQCLKLTEERHLLFQPTPYPMFFQKQSLRKGWISWVLRLSGQLGGKESFCQCWRHKRWGFSPWVRRTPWRRKWQPTPVFLPGEFHGQRSLECCSPWGRKTLDTT